MVIAREAVGRVDAACAGLEERRRLAGQLTYRDLKAAWDAVSPERRHSRMRAEVALWLSQIPASQLVGNDLAADFSPRVAETVQCLRGLETDRLG
jgi:hypothetical protein